MKSLKHLILGLAAVAALALHIPAFAQATRASDIGGDPCAVPVTTPTGGYTVKAQCTVEVSPPTNSVLSAAGAAPSRSSTTVAASNIVACSAACNAYGFNAVAGGSALYIMAFDATVAPADGTVTPAYCIPLAANAGIDVNWRNRPKRFGTGMVLVASTTGCFSKTASATAFLSVDFVQ